MTTIGISGGYGDLNLGLNYSGSGIGGSGTSAPAERCPDQPADSLVQHVFRSMSSSEYSRLKTEWNMVNASLPLDNLVQAGSWSTIARALAGGKDCKFTTYRGHRDYFDLLVAKYPVGSGSIPYPTSGSPSGSAPSTDGSKPSAGERIGDWAESVWEDVKDTVGNIVSAGAEGAAGGVKTATGGARTGSNVGGFFSSTTASVLFFGVGLVLAIMLIRKG